MKKEIKHKNLSKNLGLKADKKPDQGKKKKSLLRRFFSFTNLIKLAFYLSIIITVFCVVIFYKLSQDLPDYKALSEYNPSITSRFYSRDGSLLTEYAKERRTYVAFDEFPSQLVNAFVATEDKNFWTHNGIDFTGIARSALVNLKNKLSGSNRKLVGASTITQQVSRNFFLSADQKYTRKIKEIILSLRIEKTFSKKHIMTLYLNQIYLGNRSYGVAAAAKTYFNKGLNELSLSEMAFLAGLPKAPSSYNPTKNKEAAIYRRNWVLKRMLTEGYITQTEYESAIEDDLVSVDNLTSDQDKYSRYFAEEIRRDLTAQYGEDAFYKGGLSVRTSADPQYQKLATELLRKAMLDYDAVHGYRGSEVVYNMSAIKDEMKTADKSSLYQEVGRQIGDAILRNDKAKADKKLDLWKVLLKEDPTQPGVETWNKGIVLETNATDIKFGMKDGSIQSIKTATLKKFNVDSKVFGFGNGDMTNEKQRNKIFKTGGIILVEKTDKGAYEIRQAPKINGGLVAMDPHTGRIFALVGGFDFGRSSYNRATQALRQPGSTMKPFVYLTALESGKYLPNTIVLDAPVVMNIGNGKIWKPSNSNNTFQGEMPAFMALEKSLNNPTIRIAKDIGIANVVDTAKLFGVYSGNMDLNLSLALGSGETTLLKMTTAFSQILNGGKKVSPSMIDRVQDRDGKTIYNKDTRVCQNCQNIQWQDGLLPPELPDDRQQLVDTKLAYQIMTMMKGVVEHGSGFNARIPGREIAGKTGTSNDAKDVWFIGGTPDLVVGIFMGFDKPESLGHGGFGGTLCAPVFHDFVSTILGDSKAKTFPVPNGIRFVRINRKTGNPARPGDEPKNLETEAFLANNMPQDVSSGTEISSGNTTDDGNQYLNPNPKGGAPANSGNVNLDGIY